MGFVSIERILHRKYGRYNASSEVFREVSLSIVIIHSLIAQSI